jgi:membrane protein
MAGALGTATTLAKETVTRWTEDKASALAAALAYYSLFSLAPLVLIAVAVAGLVFGQQAAEGQLYAQLAGLIGDTGAKALQEIVARMHEEQGGGVLATIVGLATLFFGASGVFAQLQDSMNTIWKARPPTTNGIVEFLRVRPALLQHGAGDRLPPAGLAHLSPRCWQRWGTTSGRSSRVERRWGRR